jgi:hypothetical protein
LIDIVVLSVAIRVGVVRVGTLCVLLRVSQTVTIRITIGVTAIGWREAIGHLPSVWKTVTIAVGVVHVSSVVLLLSVG